MSFCTCNGWNNPISAVKTGNPGVNEFRGVIDRQRNRSNHVRASIFTKVTATAKNSRHVRRHAAPRDFLRYSPTSFFPTGLGFPDNRNRNSAGRARSWPAVPSDEIRISPRLSLELSRRSFPLRESRRIPGRKFPIKRKCNRERSKTPTPSRWAKRCCVCFVHTGKRN